MAFTIYKSSDPGSPSFYGTTGSYIALLDACLVNGYGSKPGAGWSKPFANTASYTQSFSQGIGAWKQPSGSGFYLYVHDSAPNKTALHKEAWATGWENLQGPSSSVDNSNGSGSGQFPTPTQLLTTGHVVIRKSTTSDSSSLRQWIVAADSSSFYSFIATGDTAGMYYGFGFGDIYSFKGLADSYRCMIMGRNTENVATVATDGFDLLASPINAITAGNYIARSSTGLGTSSIFSKHGDAVKGHATIWSGSIPMPNLSDDALYTSPVWVVENGSNIRGFLRGLYQPLHPIANFSDGQTFQGALDYNGKSFFIIKQGPGLGMYLVETSDTLATN